MFTTKYLLLLLSILLLSTIYCHSQERYKVNISALNVRSAPSSSGNILGVIQQGDIVNVHAKQNGWSKINFRNKYGWVASKYLSYVKPAATPSKTTQKTNDINKYLKEYSTPLYNAINWIKSYPVDPLTMIIIIVVLNAICLFLKSGDAIMSELKLWLFTSLLFIESILIVFYMVNTENPAWICMPLDVGWVIAIISFIALGWFSYMQFNLLHSQFIINESLFDTSCDYVLGLYSWPVMGVIGFIVAWLWIDYLPYIFIVLALAQIIQMIMIIVKSEDIFMGFLSALIYITTSIATITVIALFLSILIIVLIAAFILFIVLAALLGSKGTYIGSVTDSDGNTIDVYRK